MDLMVKSGLVVIKVIITVVENVTQFYFTTLEIRSDVHYF